MARAFVVNGDTAVVGASFTDGALGAAYVFERKNGVWTQQAKLVAADRSPSAEFGDSIGLVGNTMAIAAPGDRNGRGAVYIFQKDGTGAWLQQAKVTASDASEFAFFSDSMTLGEGLLVVGAELGNVPGIGSAGTAYVYRRNGSTWVEEARLQDPNPRVNGAFGLGTAIVGNNMIAIGAGKVFFYKEVGNTWVLQPNTLQGVVPGELFGLSIAVDGNFMVVGAPLGQSSSGAATGVAYMYRRNGDVWTQEARVEPADPTAVVYGARVAISGSTAVVGSAFNDFLFPANGGSAFVFQRTSSLGWNLTQQLRPPDSTPHDAFGAAVSIQGSTVLIGAEAAPAAAGVQVGAAYVYKLQ